MAPDKLEKYIQEKLRQREIQPSESAWQRISEGLQDTNPVSKKVSVWYAIAASIVVLVGFSLFYLLKGPVAEPQLDGVVVANPAVTEQGAGTWVRDQKENQSTVKDRSVKSEITETNVRKKINPSSVAVTTQHRNVDAGTRTNATETMESAMEPKLAQVSQAVLSEKITEVMAQVQQMEQNQGVSDAEIDSLLRAAQRAIITERLFTENNKVNAVALLSEVEEELDQSFRDQIFESLKSGFLKVRTAVADRNH